MKMKEIIKKRHLELLKNIDVDIAYFPNFSNEASFCYLTDLPAGSFTYNSLVIKRRAGAFLLCNALQDKILKEFALSRGFKLVNTREKGYWATLRKLIEKKNVGINYAEVSVALARKIRKETGAKLCDIRSKIEKMREVKDRDEEKRLRISAKTISQVMDKVPSFIKKGLSEKDLAEKIDAEIRILGSEPAFQTIVASGKNAATPHHIPTSKKIEKGFLIIDCGARYKNYCSDISRTFYLGKAKKSEKDIYACVAQAKIIAEDSIRAGKDARSTFEEVDSYMKSKSLKLIHALGHGIGIEAHDLPGRISNDSKFSFRTGLCFTLEPAAYGTFGGIRIEDDYIMKGKKLKKISSAKYTDTLLEIKN
ncbi:MAG: Xaa-Pro peptidase family protein [Candidatus Diapherotrites archaeon]|nr:Xaa-Pro peptidase family protein [Candidatus Diapherotrites archaeon]